MAEEGTGEMKNGKLVRVTAMFFALMLCFTILSRAADQMSVAVVQTERPQNRMIEHAVRTSGKIVQNQELAVTTLPDQRVTAIYVREGQRVAKGDLLFEVDTGLLDEKILDQQLEMEKQELQVKDAKSQKEVSAQQRANSQAQASEQYSLSTGRAGVQLARAKQQLDEAKEKLKKFRESVDEGKAGLSGGTGTADSDVEAALLQALEDKTNAYVAAQGELRTLEWEIENAVFTAKQNAAAGTLSGTIAGELSGSVSGNMSGAASGASLAAEDRVYTGAADAEDMDEVSVETGAENEAVSIEPLADDDEEIVLDMSSADAEPPVDAESGENMPGTDDASITVDMEAPEIVPDRTGADSRALDDPDADIGDMIIEDGGDPILPQPPTQEQLSQIEQTVRKSYSQRLAEAEQKVSSAQAEKETAEAALVQYQQEQLAAESSEKAASAQQLTADVRAAQQAYEDAAIAVNEAAVTSGRAVAIANIDEPSNSSDRMNEITYEQMELTLEKLEGLKKAKGKVCAEADGLITKINIMTGEKTTDTTALLMADLSKGYQFTADITKDQQKYIGTGDLVRLTSGDGKQKLEDLPVESITADENNGELYHVTVQIPEDTFEPGMNVNLDFVRKSETYPVTVPLSALHLDERQQPYVLILEEYGSIMGAEQRARKVSVTVLEQNESYAAIAEGAIGSEQELIVQSDKAVDNGSRVRVAH